MPTTKPIASRPTPAISTSRWCASSRRWAMTSASARRRRNICYDRNGAQYLDLLSGYGVFAIGRNHPGVRDALKSVLDADLPDLVQIDVSPLAGLLARAAARLHAVSRQGLLRQFRHRGGRGRDQVRPRARPRRPGDRPLRALVPRPDLWRAVAQRRRDFPRRLRAAAARLHARCRSTTSPRSSGALARATSPPSSSSRSRARASTCPTTAICARRRQLCRRHGTLFVADEIQTGLGRTGRFLAVEHWGVEPDMVLLAKALSGGHVPVGAVLTRKRIYDKVFDRMDRAVVHGSTFAKNDLAMAAGLATLDVIENERLIANAARSSASGCSRAFPALVAALRVPARRARQGADARHRVRAAAVAQAQGALEPARVRQQGAVLPAHHHPAVRASTRSWPRSPAMRATRSSCCRPLVITDADCDWIVDRLRRRDRRDPPGAGRDLVARQDAGRQRGGGKGIGWGSRLQDP